MKIVVIVEIILTSLAIIEIFSLFNLNLLSHPLASSLMRLCLFLNLLNILITKLTVNKNEKVDNESNEENPLDISFTEKLKNALINITNENLKKVSNNLKIKKEI